MKLQFIGTGGGFADINPGNSNMLCLADSGKRLLIDAGHTAPYVLRQMGITPNSADIDAIYISHLHDDHVGSLGWIALFNFFTRIASRGGDRLENRIKLYIHNSLVDEVWALMKSACSTLQGRNVDIDDFFEVHSIMDDGAFLWEGYKFELIQTLHVVANRKFMNSFGLMIQSEDPAKPWTTFLTTDTQFTYPTPLAVFYAQADQVFHDCETGFKSGVHAFFGDMAKYLDADTKKKIYLYHYNKPEADLQGFAGFVQQFDTFEL